MDFRFGLFVFLLLSGGAVCTGRHMVVSRPSFKMQMISRFPGRNEQQPLPLKNNQVCKVCEQYVDKALVYLAENKTQTEVMDILHESCSHIGSFEKECITLVDYYAPIFFSSVSSIDPDTFCKKMNLCEEIVSAIKQIEDDSCSICQQAMSELIVKLKDPDMQLEVIELLLKACKSMENYAAKCKKMVFEYGPLILANAEQFLEKTDVCRMLHACKGSVDHGKELKADA